MLFTKQPGFCMICGKAVELGFGSIPNFTKPVCSLACLDERERRYVLGVLGKPFKEKVCTTPSSDSA